MSASRSITVVSEDSLEQVRAKIEIFSSPHAAALVSGCRFWTFTNAEGFKGDIIVWPDGRAALVSTAASHWGEWDARSGRIALDNGDIYNEEGGVGEDA